MFPRRTLNMGVAALAIFTAHFLVLATAKTDPFKMLKSVPYSCPLPLKDDEAIDSTPAGKAILDSMFKAQKTMGPNSNIEAYKIICAEILPPGLEGGLGVEECAERMGKTMAKTTKCDLTEEEMKEICSEKTVPKGSFCLRSSDCVMMKLGSALGEPDKPMTEPCPIGFYCPGGFDFPHACAKGKDCSTKGLGEPGNCTDGSICIVPASPAKCSENSSSFFQGTECLAQPEDGLIILPAPCEAGYSCEEGLRKACPAGHFCPEGSSEPVKCKALEVCPEQTHAPVRIWRVMWEDSAWILVLNVILFTASRHRFGTGSAWPILIVFSLFFAWWAGELVRYITSTSKKFMMQHVLLLAAYVWYFMWGLFASKKLHQSGLKPWISMCADCLATAFPIILLVILRVDLQGLLFLLVSWMAIWGMYFLLIDGDATVFSQGLGILGASVIVILLPWLVRAQPTSHLLVVLVLLVLFALAELILVAIKHCRSFGSDDDQQGSSEGSAPLRKYVQRLSLAAVEAPPLPASLELAAQPSGLSENGEVEAPPPSSGASTDRDVEATPTSVLVREGISVELTNVSLKLPNGSDVLRNVTLDIPAGSFTAIMGPSGSGKSSITNVLSGRAGYGSVVGSITINGRQHLTIADLRAVTGFVPQDDVMHRDLSCAENLTFQAILRRPRGGGDAGKDDWVSDATNSVLERIGLSHVRDSLIGDENVRGISGGQRKRVSIGMELIAQPKILFLDEPTSGLDSTTSHSVISDIKKDSVEHGTTTLAVIHQPRYETFLQFDYAIFVAAGGYLAYAGKTTSAMQYFEKRLGVTFPATSNPADIFMDAITIDSARNLADEGKMKLPGDINDRNSLGDFLSDTWRASKQPYAASSKEAPAQLPDLHPSTSSWSEATLAQVQRAALQTRRSLKQVVGMSCVMGSGILACLSAIPVATVQDAMAQPALVLFFVMLCQSVQSHRIFGGAERVVSWREAGVGSNMMLYFAGRDLFALVEVLFATVVVTALYWPMMPLLLSHHTFFWAMFAFIYAIYGFGMLLSILLPASSAQMVAVLISFLGFLLTGVQPPFRDLISGTHGVVMYLMAFSPMRWVYGFLIREHVLRSGDSGMNNPMIRTLAEGALKNLGIPLAWINDQDADSWQCNLPVRERWMGAPLPDDSEFDGQRPVISTLCNVTPLYYLGIWFRFLCIVWLLIVAKTSVTGSQNLIEGSGRTPRANALVNACLLVLMLALTNCQVSLLLSTY